MRSKSVPIQRLQCAVAVPCKTNLINSRILKLTTILLKLDQLMIIRQPQNGPRCMDRSIAADAASLAQRGSDWPFPCQPTRPPPQQYILLPPDSARRGGAWCLESKFCIYQQQKLLVCTGQYYLALTLVFLQRRSVASQAENSFFVYNIL